VHDSTFDLSYHVISTIFFVISSLGENDFSSWHVE